jgi:proteasome lid subunit RPN8/RPN11
MKLQVSADAFAKLVRCRDTHDTEVGGWFVSDSLDNLLYVSDFQTVKQTVTTTTVEFDDDDMTDYISRMSEQEIWPAMCQKIWVHTHPGNSSSPSGTDWNTLNSMMEKIDVNDWVIMFILAMDNSYTCKLAYKTPFGNIFQDIKCEFLSYYYEEWDEEFKKNIHKKVFKPVNKTIFKSNYTPKNLPSYNDTQKTVPWLTGSSSEVETDLCAYDIPEILFSHKADSFLELDPLVLKSIADTHGCPVDQLLEIETAMVKGEKDLSAEYEEILKEYEVTGLDKLTEKQWEEIVSAYMISKAGLTAYEFSLFSNSSNITVNTNALHV